MSAYKTRRRCVQVTTGLLLAALLAGLGNPSRAAEPAATLDQSLSQAMEKNPAIVAAKAKIALAEAELSSTRLEVARQVIVLRGNWETQKNEAAAARKTLDRLTATRQRDRSAVAESVLDQARSALVDAEAKLTRTQTELRYLTGQVSLQGANGAPGLSDRGGAPPGNALRSPSASARPTPRPAHPPRAAKPGKAQPAVAPEMTLQLVNGLTADKIRQVLEQPAELRFQETPLRDAMASLAAKYHLDVRLDRQALDATGIADDVPITASINRSTLKAALAALLMDLDLTWVVQDGVLLITSMERADEMLVTVIYPVLDLLPPPPKEPRKPVNPRSLGGAAPGGADHAAPSAAGRLQSTPWVPALGDWDALIDLITSTVKPASWDSVGGPGSIAPFENRGVLIISQTEQVQSQIAELLDLLHKGAAVAPQSASSGIQAEIGRRIFEALEQPVQLSAGRRPLAEVLAILEKDCKVPIQLNRKALDELHIAPDAPVNAEIRGVPLRSALHLLLHDLRLTYTIKTEALMVTSPEDADRNLLTVIYPVDDVVTIPDQSALDFDSLIELITSTVKPTTWDAVGGSGSIAPFEKGNLLVVSQTLPVHEEIGQLLKSLRQHPVAKLPAPKP